MSRVILAGSGQMGPQGISDALSEDADYLEFIQLIEDRLASHTALLGEADDGDSWRDLDRRATALLRRAPSLWVAVYATIVRTRLEGPTGLSEGLAGIAALLSDHWDELHPPPEPEDEPFRQRVHALDEFGSPRVLPIVRDATLFKDANEQPVRLRDVLMALGALPVPEGATRPDPADLQRRFVELRQQSPQAANEPLDATARALELIDQISARLQQQAGAAPLRLVSLRGYLSSAVKLLTQIGSAESADMASAGNGMAHPDPHNAQAAGPAIPAGELSSREQAIAVLEKVIRFLQRTEPSSPVPLLLERGKRLMGKSFLQCVEELGKGGLSEVRLVAGITEEEESD